MSDHILVVGEWDDDQTEWDVEHPAECPTFDYPDATPENPHVGFECGIGLEEQNGLNTFFIHRDDPERASAYQERVAPGRHRIEHWTRQVQRDGPWGPAEWDAGVCLVVDE